MQHCVDNLNINTTLLVSGNINNGIIIEEKLKVTTVRIKLALATKQSTVLVHVKTITSPNRPGCQRQ